MSPLPLDGLLVIALEQAVAAPYCTRRLCDAGARVIKIERKEGDFARHYDQAVHGESANFLWLNGGKESLVLNIKDPQDQKLLHRMLKKADVFVQNLAPGAAQRSGFGSEDLRKLYPRLITCTISGYGEEGPYAHMKAYDLLVQGETGLCALTGSPENAGRVGVSVCDIAAGMNACQGIMEALIARGRTGRGQGVSVSLFDGLADWMTVPYLQYAHTKIAPKRVGVSHPSIAPYGVFETKDAAKVIIAIQNEREWAIFCKTFLHQPDWAKEGPFCSAVLRVENRKQLDETVQKAIAQIPFKTLCAKLEEAKIAYGRLNDMAGFLTHPALRTLESQSQTGTFTLPAPAIHLSDHPKTIGPVPEIGAHSAAIRKEFADND